MEEKNKKPRRKSVSDGSKLERAAMQAKETKHLLGGGNEAKKIVSPLTVIPCNQSEALSVFHTIAGINDTMGIVRAAYKGVPARQMELLFSLTDQPREKVVALFHITSRTLSNYLKAGDMLNTAMGEQLIRLLSLYERGQQVFGSKDAFNEWLQLPAYGLDELIPFSLLSAIGGIELVHQAIEQIAYGDIS
jgi:putative toxin-antitoxin system antitoxin component (TIGR02293 family)